MNFARMTKAQLIDKYLGLQADLNKVRSDNKDLIEHNNSYNRRLAEIEIDLKYADGRLSEMGTSLSACRVANTDLRQHYLEAQNKNTYLRWALYANAGIYTGIALWFIFS